MANPFAKTRQASDPYAVYRAGDLTWHVIKTYKLAKNEAGDPYARWMVAAKSDATFGSFELGDTYARDVRSFGQLIAATPAWLEAYGTALQRQRGLPAPTAFLELEA